MRPVKFIEINNLKIAYQVEGAGKTVVLLHGWGAEANTFKSVFNWLSDSHQVFALDLPGFGLSEIPQTAWDATDYAKFLSTFFYKLSINKAHLIGHSYGGRISIVMAAEEPEKVDKLILVDSAGIIPTRTAKYYLKISLAKFGRLMRRCGTFGNNLADVIAQSIGSKDYKEAGPMRATMVKSVNQNLRPLLPKIQASTLLIWGENDLDTPISFGEIMEEEIPNAGLVILKDAGHYSYLDQFPQFCQIVGNFLA
jgi:pimeloyl-ACP methyl ester carboxylesterase